MLDSGRGLALDRNINNPQCSNAITRANHVTGLETGVCSTREAKSSRASPQETHTGFGSRPLLKLAPTQRL
jgi:hypothetical protein